MAAQVTLQPPHVWRRVGGEIGAEQIIDDALRGVLDEDELHNEFVLTPGSGGQHINKADSAVQLRFDVVASPYTRDDAKRRLEGEAKRSDVKQRRRGTVQH